MNIQENHDLKSLNSFGLPARARYFCTLDDLGHTVRLRDWQAQHPELPLLFLGGGSNLLFVGDFPGLVVQVRLESLEILEGDSNYNYIRAGAGNNWHRFVRWTIDQGFAGLENLSLIPGTVGAAPMQNIGAYGVELKDCLQSVRAVDWRNGEVRDFSREDCRFGYRDSSFKSVEPDRWLILSVTFALPREPRWKTDYADLRELLEGKALNARVISEAVIALRRSKLPDPAQIGNAGSFFKNPMVSAEQWQTLKAANPAMPGWPQPDGGVKTSAGWLIDQCGWKGRREGDAGTYSKHALVLVNHGNATGAEVWRFAQGIIASVQERFGIRLEPEPRVIGG
ncbi:MAG: UDP-N-acetylenolpyruvoylglucosamine reductase [Gammaproteobacteria bacterium RIFOXYA12_FULL_61_12]|nr:MAG: UDP-N-acetylenolpyruvoylglucosamine reductase [Gammaproteobacteria bacterium RIFOXYD12_FULL_61_37]OGT91167.1 MAG: UDP-N-acetylenolpyruvoylglucosamine reductase [Gammaproteobacteria bacterium RIFOXYA12_FULL_61_12]